MDKFVSKIVLRSGSCISKRDGCMEQQLKQILRSGKTFRQIHQLARKLATQSAICNSCLLTGKSHSHNDPLRQMMLKYSTHSRELPAIASILRSPAFASCLNSQDQYFRWFHTSGLKLDREKRRDRAQTDKEQPNDENEDKDGNKKSSDLFFSLITLVVGLTLLFNAWSNEVNQSRKMISWNEFYYEILLKGEVKSIDLKMSSEETGENYAVVEIQDGAVIKGQVTSSQVRYIVRIPSNIDMEERVRHLEDQMGMVFHDKDRIPITHSYTSSWVHVFLTLAISGAFLAVAMAVLKRVTKTKDGNVTDVIDMLSGGIRQAKFTRVDIASRGAKAISFKDVAGLKEAKVEIIEFVDYLTNPQRFQKLGAKTPRGAILLGPPGCGKTLLARALATEAKVPFLAMAGSEFVEMIGGVGAARVRSLFKEARARAPCIIYIDEIDAIGRKRGGSASVGGEDEHTLNQLLVEMDGIGTQEGVIMIAATNRADVLDKALLRPGRFDRHITIDLPTLEEREEIFMVYLDKLKLAQSPSVYAKPLSKLTPGMSGADIDSICNEAAIHAARDCNKVIDTKDFEYAVERVIAGVEKKTGLLSPTEKKVVAYHESGHALVGWMLEHTDALLRVSILPRTTGALGFTQYLPTDQHLYSQEQLFERMCMALGGRAAESLVFNHVSTGAHDDLNRVTEMAYNQIRSYGMNARVGHLSFPSDKEQSGQRPYSQRLSEIMDEEARNLVTKAFLHTQKVLQDNRDKLNTLATALLEKEALSYDDICELIGAPPYGKKNLLDPDAWRGIEEVDLTDNDNGNGRSKRSSRQKRK